MLLKLKQSLIQPFFFFFPPFLLQSPEMYSHVSTRNVIYIQACKRLVNQESIVKMLILQMLVEGIERLSSAWYNDAKKKNPACNKFPCNYLSSASQGTRDRNCITATGLFGAALVSAGLGLLGSVWSNLGYGEKIQGMLKT